jgi:1-acyl-sn-glycerol-3-phosphate acyltransferase
MHRTLYWCLRRLVLAPLMPLLAVVSILLWALGLVLSALLCPLIALARRRKPRWRLIRVQSFGVAYFLGETVCLVCCLALWTGTGGRLRSARSVRAHQAQLAGFLGGLVRTASLVFGFRLLVNEPDRHPIDVLRAEGSAPIVVLARHAGPGASFALVQLLISRYGRRVKVVLKEQLRLDPAIDILLSRTGCTWLPANPRAGQAAASVEEAAAALDEHDALVLFPEGADWTPLRHLQAVARLRGRGLVGQARAALRMPHVLPPRPAGTLAALRGAPHADVLVFTHTGHDRLLDATSSWQALPLQEPLRMAWWRAPAGEVPRDNEDNVAEWLQQTWRDIDAWIDEQQGLAEIQVPRTSTEA